MVLVDHGASLAGGSSVFKCLTSPLPNWPGLVAIRLSNPEPAWQQGVGTKLVQNCLWGQRPSQCHSKATASREGVWGGRMAGAPQRQLGRR